MTKKRAWERRDPEAKAEARKYPHPVPSRAYILRFLEERGVPAPLDDDQTVRCQELAIAAMRVLEGEGLGRIDFLLDRVSGEFYINEVNSLPGFTEASMFPRLWEASGLPYPALLDRLIELALERHREREGFETVYRRS